jgi:PAS domain-containing protein
MTPGYMSSRTARLIGSRIEVTALRRNGEVFPVELALSATNIGENWQFTALIQDISERRAQTELFENAFDYAPIGMALVALDGHLLKLNSAFCDLIGYEHAEATTLDFQAILGRTSRNERWRSARLMPSTDVGSGKPPLRF